MDGSCLAEHHLQMPLLLVSHHLRRTATKSPNQPIQSITSDMIVLNSVFVLTLLSLAGIIHAKDNKGNYAYANSNT